MTASAFFFHLFGALTESNALGPVQMTESEKTCTLALSMLSIGSSKNDLSIHHRSGIRLKMFLHRAK